MPDTDPSATLAGIQDRLDDLDAIRLRRHIIAEESVNLKLHAITEDFCRLVAALEAVLALADKWDAALAGGSLHPHARALRTAITTALTGEERCDGEAE